MQRGGNLRRNHSLRGQHDAQLVASLLARIDGLMAQIAARDDRIDELLSQVKALNARIAELEAKRGGPPETPDNSSLPCPLVITQTSETLWCVRAAGSSSACPLGCQRWRDLGKPHLHNALLTVGR